MATDDRGRAALMEAAEAGQEECMRLLLKHAADPAAMMAHMDANGRTALMLAAAKGHAGGMQVLLDHPSANPAAMMMHANNCGFIALMHAAAKGHAGTMQLLLDHPSVNVAAMLAVRTPSGASALTAAAGFAIGSSLNREYAPLLLLLRRVDVGPQPCAAEEAHMTKVLETCHGNQKALLNVDQVDQPDDPRDECVRLLLARGAEGLSNTSVVKRVIRESCALQGLPHRINEAVVGIAIARKRPRDSA
ncbi:hypothetical protein FOA52_014616 [Chlamydomonas sp. UWO 241]|nr:hypothetical protein FOA52_014616 [Chlamydomonas sp. UWO 241]